MGKVHELMERVAWACNTCNLVTWGIPTDLQVRHPGWCLWCGCPEHRMVFSVEEADQIEATRRRFLPDLPAKPVISQGDLFGE